MGVLTYEGDLWLKYWYFSHGPTEWTLVTQCMVWRIPGFFSGFSCWCLIIPGCSDICGWPVEDIWVTYGNLAKDQWTHWVNIGDPMNGLKNPWVFPGGAQLFLGVLTYAGDLWNKYDKWVKINNFLGAPVLFYLAYLLTSSDILSGTLSGISSDILSGVSTDILSGISSDIFWQFFWYSMWHIFWYSIWHIFWHSIWHIFWYLLTVFLALYLAYLLTFYLAYLLTFYLAYLLISSDILSGTLSGISSDILSGISFDILSYLLISSDILSGTLSGISSDILSGISSDILSGISSDIFWHSFWHSITGDETAHNRS